MSTVTVMDKFSPSKKGPGYLSAKVALDEINKKNKSWIVKMDWEEKITKYSSGVASKSNLQVAVKAHFSDSLYAIV